MIKRGLEPDFPPAAWQELAAIHDPAKATAGLRDLRDRLWTSSDSDDSRNLDQLTVAESLAGGRSVGSKASAWVTAFRVKLIEHKEYADKNGQDLPEVRNWKWGE